MEQKYEEFGTRFAKAAIAKDYVSLHEILAPWLRSKISVSDLAERLVSASDELPEPEQFTLDANSSTYEDLREPDGYAPRSEPFDPGVTAESFRQWLCIEFRPADDSDFDACYDLWLAIVEVEGRLAVGYFEPTDAD